MRKLSVFVSAILCLFAVSCNQAVNNPTQNGLSSAKAITAFSLNGVAGVINDSQKTITVTMPVGTTSLSALTETFTTTGDSVFLLTNPQVSGYSIHSYETPLVFTVKAADGSTQKYTVTVGIAKNPLIAFSLNGIPGKINEAQRSVSVTMPYGADVTALVATFTTSDASVKVGSTVQVSGTTAHDFSTPIVYTITSKDASVVDFTVTVTVRDSAADTTISLPRTGQTTCYDYVGSILTTPHNGQDGDLQKGIVWPTPRFIDNGDQTITDTLTGLMWTKDANAPGPAACTPGVVKDWLGALAYIKLLNANNYLGHSDWRLPNRKELRSLVNYEQSDIALWLQAQGFANVQENWYWSSTTYARLPEHAWLINMSNGILNTENREYGNKSDALYVWPVRDGQSGIIKLPQTGQTICFDQIGTVITTPDNGQDGNLQIGVAWPFQRFVDNGDSTITDKLTNLMWTKDANAALPAYCTNVAHTWLNSFTYIDELNAHNYLGHSDWRLPNINELESIVNVGEKNTTTWLLTQGFINIKIGYYYWSSTTYAPGTSAAWVLDIPSGALHTYDKTASDYCPWPVRTNK